MHIPTISVGFLVPVVVATAAFWVSGLAVGAAVAAAAEAEDPFAANVRPTEPRTPAEQLKTLKVPAGFAVQLVAHEPDVHKPMNLAFDAAGRLWVTTSREYPFPVPVGQAGRDRVMIFEDFGADGRARKVTEFAGGLNIPTGVYPFRTPNTEGRDTWKAVVWSIPNLWLMEDTDGDGKADRREKLYGPFDHTRDTHGNQSSFRRGFDGWLYATHGFNNDSHVAGRDGHRVDLNSGNTYRMRLDGSRLEHYTWGQVNPFGLAWDPQGNLYSSDCHSEPIYLLLAGGYYPSFGKPDDGLGFAPNMMEKIRGSTAIDGISFYADNLWPAEYRDAVFVGDVMTSRVYRDTAVARGSGRVTRQEPDFVVSEDPWFRPVDTTIGPDGAMYVADFYNRIIGHYEVPLNHPGRDRERGRIWRVVPLNAEGKPALRNPAIAPDLEGLVGELGSPSLPRRMLAMNDLADRFGTNAVPRLRQVLTDMRGRSSFPENTEDAFRHVHALWLLERLGAGDWSPRGFGLAYPASRGNPLLRIHTRRILIHRGEQAAAGDAEARERVKPLLAAMAIPNLKDPDPVVRRVSAQALATTPAFEHLRPLLDALALADPVDTHLVYALRQALRNQLLDGAVMARVLDATWSAADTKALAGVAVAARTEGAGVFLVRHLDRLAGDGDLTSRALAHAARYAPSADVDTLVAAVRQRSPGDVDFQLGLFRSLQQGFAQRGTALSAAMSDWGAGLARALLASVATGRSEPAGVPPTAVAPANVVARQVAAAELVGAVGGAAEDTRAVLARLAQDRSADPAARGAAARVVSEDPVVRAAAELAADGGQPREWRVRDGGCFVRRGPGRGGGTDRRRLEERAASVPGAVRGSGGGESAARGRDRRSDERGTGAGGFVAGPGVAGPVAAGGGRGDPGGDRSVGGVAAGRGRRGAADAGGAVGGVCGGADRREAGARGVRGGLCGVPPDQRRRRSGRPAVDRHRDARGGAVVRGHPGTEPECRSRVLDHRVDLEGRGDGHGVVSARGGRSPGPGERGRGGVRRAEVGGRGAEGIERVGDAGELGGGVVGGGLLPSAGVSGEPDGAALALQRYLRRIDRGQHGQPGWEWAVLFRIRVIRVLRGSGSERNVAGVVARVVGAGCARPGRSAAEEVVGVADLVAVPGRSVWGFRHWRRLAVPRNG
jgi:glucose/arabinose dehydrogenase